MDEEKEFLHSLSSGMLAHSVGEERAPKRSRVVSLQIRVSSEIVEETSVEAEEVKSADDGAICDICGKSFKSNKALCGHMRTHPERKWRGMDSSRPNSWERGRSGVEIRDLASSSSSNGGVDEAMWEAALTLVQMANGGRDDGRTGADFLPKKASKIPETEDDVETKTKSSNWASAAPPEHRCEQCGAVYLSGQALGGHKRLHWSGRPAEKCISVADGESDIQTRNQNFQRATAMDEEKEFLHSLSSRMQAHSVGDERAPKRRRVMSLQMRVPGEIVEETSVEAKEVKSADDGAICAICSKSFKSNKALWGHMRTHPERKWRGMDSSRPNSRETGRSGVETRDLASFSNGGVDEAMREAAFTLLLMADGGRDDGRTGADSLPRKTRKIPKTQALEERKAKSSPRALAAPPEHRCEECGAVYLSGQALGGHKRMHWSGRASSSSRVEEREKNAEEGTPKVFDFDLNELPGGEG